MTTESFPLKLDLAPDHKGSIHLSAKIADSSPQRKIWKIELTAGSYGFTGSLSLQLELPPADEQPWFLLPGFFYGEGRRRDTLAYPALGENSEDPWRLPSWDFSLDRLSYPVALSRQGNHWQGIDWTPHYDLLDSNSSQWGDSEPQIGVGLTWESGQGNLRLNLPANEGPIRHNRQKHSGPTHRKLNLKAHQVLSFQMGIWEFEGESHAYQRVLETVYEELRSNHPAAIADSDQVLAESASHGLLAWHWIEDPGYMVYTTPFHRGAEFNANNKGTTLCWHFEATGFVGGFPIAFGLLWQSRENGDPEAERVAMKMLDRMVSGAQTEWGLFRTSWHPGKARTPNGDFPNPAPVGDANQDPSGETPFWGSCWQNQSVIHARTTADASFYLARILHLMGASHPRYGAWKQALRRSLEAALDLQLPNGRFGQLYHVNDRKIAKEQGDGGLLWIPALDWSHDLFNEDPEFQRYLIDAMQFAGEGYADAIRDEFICGAPEDVSLAPTSEDGYNAVMAYGAIHRRFPNPENLKLFTIAADWLLTWRKAYNVRFHPKNLLGAMNYRTVGGDYASSRNNHLHVYGMNCLADLYYLAEITGKDFYRKRAQDHFNFCSQLLCTTDGQWGGQRGMADEQFYITDWSIWDQWDPTIHHRQKGTILGSSHCWCINMILLGLEECQRTQSTSTQS